MVIHRTLMSICHMIDVHNAQTYRCCMFSRAVAIRYVFIRFDTILYDSILFNTHHFLKDFKGTV